MLNLAAYRKFKARSCSKYLYVLYTKSIFLPTFFYVYFVEKKSQCLQIKYQNGSRNCKKFSRLISNPFLSPKKRNKNYFLKKVDYEIIFKINCLHLENLSFLVWTAPVVDLLDVSLPVVVSRKRFSALLTAKRFHAYKARHFLSHDFLAISRVATEL
jgi:hypothetical protein